ncbi:MAG: NlpC/P60 family protein [Armatimonadetes bacterium]|nr:NlpC/P60 family protein [Armatimonadota bacterium]
MPSESATRRRRWTKVGWGISWGVAVLAWLWPVNEAPIRLLLLLGLAGVWLGTLLLFWRHRWARYPVIATVALGVFLAAPGGGSSTGRLRSEYIRCLRAYTGARYLWGGESHLAIDCSGLVRRGLIDANLRVRFASGDPALARRAISMWWFDSSARALRDGYRGLTRPVAEAKKLNGFDHAGLLPGDLACTADGVHVLAYVGAKTWVSAAPGRTVKEFRAEPPNEGWFEVPVKIVRWRQLDEPQH